MVESANLVKKICIFPGWSSPEYGDGRLCQPLPFQRGGAGGAVFRLRLSAYCLLRQGSWPLSILLVLGFLLIFSALNGLSPWDLRHMLEIDDGLILRHPIVCHPDMVPEGGGGPFPQPYNRAGRDYRSALLPEAAGYSLHRLLALCTGTSPLLGGEARFSGCSVVSLRRSCDEKKALL